jgi:hypothetical protein
MMRRRRFLSSCVGCVTATLFGPVGWAEQRSARDIEGCLLIGGDTKLFGLESRDFGALPSDDQLTNTTGDPELDRALGRALARTASTFKVSPGFAFFRDENAPNAYASDETLVAGTRGTVLFGRRLFGEQFRRYSDKGMSVLAIVAHEFGHIAQYSRNLVRDLRANEPTVRRIELHADYLAGWYLGVRKRQDPSVSLWASGDTFHRIGDYQFNNPNHHGTPEQRVASSERGFELGFGKQSDFSGAVEEGRRYIRSLF